MFGKKDKLGNIKVASKFMLSLKKTAANVGHFGVQLHFIRSTTALQVFKTATPYIAGSCSEITSSIISAGFNRHHHEEIVELSADQNQTF